MPYRGFYISNDMIMLPGKRSRKFLNAVIERTGDLDISIFLSATMTMMADDYAFYTKLKKGNVTSMYTVFGFDSVSQKLFHNTCSKSEWQRNIDIVKIIEDNDIHFFASYGIGFDDQDPGVIERILRFSEETGIDLAEFFIAMTFPGTPFGDCAEKENRVILRDYSLWNQANVVFKPKHFTEDELLKGYYDLWEQFYLNKNYRDTTRSFDLAQRE